MSQGVLHPSGRPFRFLVLLFASLLLVGCYFAYDIVGAVSPSLVDELGATREEVGGLYTAYSIAAILALLVCGIMIDRVGVRLSSLLFTLVVTLGAAIVWLAPSYPVFVVGRLVFGAGSEPLVVAQSAILARWFKGKELALAFGVALVFSRLGTIFAFDTGELIAAEYGGVRWALFAAVALCVFSLLANVVYVVLDRRGARTLQLAEPGAGDRLVLGDIAHFPPSFWFVCFLCVTFYSAIFPFTALSTDFFVDKWQIPRVAEATGGFFQRALINFLHPTSTAGGLTKIPILASMVCAAFAGWFVDRHGRRASLMILGSLVLIPAHLALGLSDVYPALPMVALGIAFVLVPAAMWPAVPLLVRKERVGTAFALMTMIQNFGLAAFPWLNGLLRDRTEGYTSSQIMFASLGVAGLIFAVLLKRADRREGGALEAPSGEA